MRFPERLDWLTRCLLGVPALLNAECGQLSNTISELLYQLLTAVAGTLLEAQLQNAEVAIFLVHEFRTTATLDVKLEANEKARASFFTFSELQIRDSIRVIIRNRLHSWSNFNYRPLA
jgi:hypothetical protein